jgi:hypothetical protein
VGIECNGRSKAPDGRLSISGHKGIIATEAMSIIGVSRREPYCPSQHRKLRAGRKRARYEFFADQQQVEAGEKTYNRSKLPTSPVWKLSCYLHTDPSVLSRSPIDFLHSFCSAL